MKKYTNAFRFPKTTSNGSALVFRVLLRKRGKYSLRFEHAFIWRAWRISDLANASQHRSLKCKTDYSIYKQKITFAFHAADCFPTVFVYVCVCALYWRQLCTNIAKVNLQQWLWLHTYCSQTHACMHKTSNWDAEPGIWRALKKIQTNFVQRSQLLKLLLVVVLAKENFVVCLSDFLSSIFVLSVFVCILLFCSVENLKLALISIGDIHVKMQILANYQMLLIQQYTVWTMYSFEGIHFYS